MNYHNSIDPSNQSNSLHTLSEILKLSAIQSPDEQLIFQEGEQFVELNYRSLYERAMHFLGGLQKLGIKNKSPLLLHLSKSSELITAFWACVLGGYSPVLTPIPVQYSLDSEDVKKLLCSWRTVNKAPIITSSGGSQQVRKILLSAGESDLDILGFDQLDISDEGLETFSCHDDLAFMLLTSGSTGNPKLVEIYQDSVIACAEGFIKKLSITKNDRSLNSSALNYVGALVMYHIRDVMNQSFQIHLDHKVVNGNPLLCLEYLSKFKITNTWGPNNFYGRITKAFDARNYSHIDLSHMRYFINGGEQIHLDQAEEFCSKLECLGVKRKSMTFAWGMIETASISIVLKDALLQSHDLGEDKLYMSQTFYGISAKVVSSDGLEVKDGEQGILKIKGQQLTRGYHSNKQATDKSFDAEGWFDTGDLAIIKDGKVAITGRAKDMIIVNASNFFCHEVEATLANLTSRAIDQIIAVGHKLAGDTTEMMAIFYRSDDGLEKMPDFSSAVYDAYGLDKVIAVNLGNQNFPMTEIGKVQRSKLQKKLADGDFMTSLQKVA